MPVDPLLLPPGDAAKIIGVSRGLFFIMAADGRLGPAPIRFGRKVLYRADELRRWIDASCPPANVWRKQRDGSQSNA